MSVLDSRGQTRGGMIKTIFVGIILAVVMGMATSMVIANMPTNQSYSTTQENFDSVSDWTLDNTGSLSISHDTTNNWLDVTPNSSGSGTATASQVLDVVSLGGGVNSATAELAYQVPGADNLTDENIKLIVEQPDGDAVVAKSVNLSTTSGWTSWSVDISNNIDQTGDYTLKGYVEASYNGTSGANETNLDNAQLSVTTEGDTLGVIDMARSMGPTIVTFVFLGLLVLAIVGLIRYFRAI